MSTLVKLDALNKSQVNIVKNWHFDFSNINIYFQSHPSEIREVVGYLLSLDCSLVGLDIPKIEYNQFTIETLLTLHKRGVSIAPFSGFFQFCSISFSELKALSLIPGINLRRNMFKFELLDSDNVELTDAMIMSVAEVCFSNNGKIQLDRHDALELRWYKMLKGCVDPDKLKSTSRMTLENESIEIPRDVSNLNRLLKMTEKIIFNGCRLSFRESVQTVSFGSLIKLIKIFGHSSHTANWAHNLNLSFAPDVGLESHKEEIRNIILNQLTVSQTASLKQFVQPKIEPGFQFFPSMQQKLLKKIGEYCDCPKPVSANTLSH